jgi:hypothetical protein
MSAINTINKAVIYTTLLDEIIRAGLTSAPLEAGAGRVKYTGGGSCMIPKISTGGYGAYDRGSTGYPQGAVVQEWETKTISQDRGVKFSLDVMDEDETANVLSATNVIADFGKRNAIPELDAYRYSSIFQAIVNDTTVVYGYYTPAVATLLTTIQGKIADIQNIIGQDEPLVIFMSGDCFKYLTTSTELQKQLSVETATGANGVTTKIFSIDGVKIIPVPSSRMYTEYAFSATNGFAAKAWAMSINFIIMSPNAAVAFVKHQKTKVISADQNQSADAELVLSRTVHDLWMYDNKHEAVYISLKVATIAGFSAAELSTTGATNVTYTIASYATRDTSHKFYYYDGGTVAATAAPAAYDVMVLTGYVEITSASPVADVVTSGYYGALLEIDENGRAVRFKTIKAA